MIIVAANQDTVFKRLAATMGQPELAEDQRYATHGARGTYMEELDGLVANWTSQHDADELLELLHASGVPASRIFKAADMFADPHFAARNAIVRIPDSQFGELAMHNVAPKLSATPGRIASTGPELGEHNEIIYNKLLGMTLEEIEKYRQDGII